MRGLRKFNEERGGVKNMEKMFKELHPFIYTLREIIIESLEEKPNMSLLDFLKDLDAMITEEMKSILKRITESQLNELIGTGGNKV